MKTTHADILNIVQRNHEEALRVAAANKEELINLIKDVVAIFSDSQDRLRNELRSEMLTGNNSIKNDLQLFKQEMYEFRTEMYEFRSEMYQFRNETQVTLADHSRRFGEIQQDITLLGGLERRVTKLEHAAQT